MSRLSPLAATWAAVLASILVCAGISALHLRQRVAQARTAALLGEIRQARIDLTRGFLALRLAGEPAFAEGREAGVALLGQALRALEHTQAAEGEPEPGERLRRAGAGFQAQLQRWLAEREPTPRLHTELLLAFAAVEREADLLDARARARLDAIAVQSSREFALTLVAAALLLGVVCVLVLRAARAREASDRALAQAREELVHAQRLESIGRLAGGIAHDFNNLLTVISGCTELARRQLEPAHAAQPHLEGLASATRRATALTTQLLAFARRQVTTRKLVNLNCVVQEVEDLLRRLIGQRVAIEVQLAPELWPVRVDPVQFEQVLFNLAVNARDAMPEGGRLRILTSNESQDGQELVQVVVEDDGPGMDEHTLAHAFEPFFTTKARGKGTGLGLATCHGIVLQNEGRIVIHSSPGRGARFEVLFPRAPLELGLEAEPVTAASRPAPPREPSRGGEVLVVEDDPSVRALAVEALSGAGYVVLEAESGHAALELVAEGRAFQLVLTDLAMPGMSGQELVRRVRELRPGVPILYVSGYSDVELSPQELPFLIPKPYGIATLLERVEQALATWPGHQEPG